jgi:ABC-type sugar transport system ATPase subunit
MLLDEPTRGVDVGARADIYRLVRDLAAGGTAVILASSDLPELIGLSDRIAILHAGRIAATLRNAGLDEAGLLAQVYAAGGRAA